MKALDLLRQEASERRVYRTTSDIMDTISRCVADFQQRYPDTDWSPSSELVAGKRNKGEYDFAVRHMIRWGKADARVIEDAFQVKLPDSIHELYAHIQEAYLVWRNIIHIMHPDEVVSWERQNREWEGKGGGSVRLVRFIQSRWTSGDIGFRKSVSDDRWRVYYAAVDDAPGHEDASRDGHDLADDLDSWLQYLMTNDGAFSPDEQDHAHAEYLIARISDPAEVRGSA